MGTRLQDEIERRAIERDQAYELAVHDFKQRLMGLLNGMDLHDDTGHAYDEGYREALREAKEAVAVIADMLTDGAV